MSDSFICPCCNSEIGIDDDGSLYVMSSLSKHGVTSSHSGDERFYQYLPETTPNYKPTPQKLTPIAGEVLMDGDELLIDDRTASLVHKALVKDLFDRGLIQTTDT
jgi:hypothetical protein